VYGFQVAAIGRDASRAPHRATCASEPFDADAHMPLRALSVLARLTPHHEERS
jgi:hypothetical protein